MPLLWPGEFQITSPPITLGDVVVIGRPSATTRASWRLPARCAPLTPEPAHPAGTGIRSPRTGDNPAAPTWEGTHPPQEGHANAWAPMAVDERRGLVFVPTSSPSPDFFGGLRPGSNRHANSVVALDGLTGSVRWSFQTVHHDIWDYDVPAQPGLYSVWRDGRLHDVVAQVTKTGFVFVLDRDTGEPFLPVEERPVPQVAVPGEWLSPTQPFPVATPPLVPNRLAAEDAFGLILLDRLACRNRIADSVADGLFTPPSEQGTLFYPFTGGGANWGGAAYDPGTQPSDRQHEQCRAPHSVDPGRTGR